MENLFLSNSVGVRLREVSVDVLWFPNRFREGTQRFNLISIVSPSEFCSYRARLPKSTKYRWDTYFHYYILNVCLFVYRFLSHRVGSAQHVTIITVVTLHDLNVATNNNIFFKIFASEMAGLIYSLSNS